MLDEWASEYHQGLSVWSIRIAHDGTVKYAHSHGAGRPTVDFFFPAFGSAEKVKGLQTQMFARDEKHAVKIANERRAIHIANGTWGINSENEEMENS